MGGTSTQFLSSGSRVDLESFGSTVTAQYGYGNALVHKDGEYPLFDGQGSERTVTNSGQTVTGSINYDAFGNTAGTSGASSSAYQYCATSGYRTDGDAGLQHVGARYYDAQVGRFTSRDTELDQHPYLYCGHDPVNGVDPSGHATPWQVIRAIGKALVLWALGDTGPSPPPGPPPPPPPAITGPGPGSRTGGSSGGSGGSGGSGTGTGGGVATIGIGLIVGGAGAAVVSAHRRRIETYLDENGDWR